MMKRKRQEEYRGRLAPSPSGHLHVGHAQTFWIAKERARKYSGQILLRIEDIDIQRCKTHYLPDMIEDLTWFGVNWDQGYLKEQQIGNNQGEDLSDPSLNYIQSKRFALYAKAWKILYDKGFIYPCKQSRRDVDAALSAPHDQISTSSDSSRHQNSNNIKFPIQRTEEMKKLIESIPNESIFPSFLRPSFLHDIPFGVGNNHHFPEEFQGLTSPFDKKINWRFRIPDDYQPISFLDSNMGLQSFIPGLDFGDFLVWRLDGYPSYELAVIVDDILMKITEVVRGQDLLISTARQLLLIHAIFGLDFHNPLHWHSVAEIIKKSHGNDTDAEDEENIALTRDGPKQEGSEEVHQLNETRDEAHTPSNTEPFSPPESDYDPNNREVFNLFSTSENDYKIPCYFHLPLVCDENGVRLAKRNFAKSLRNLREERTSPEQIREKYFQKQLPI